MWRHHVEITTASLRLVDWEAAQYLPSDGWRLHPAPPGGRRLVALPESEINHPVATSVIDFPVRCCSSSSSSVITGRRRLWLCPISRIGCPHLAERWQYFWPQNRLTDVVKRRLFFSSFLIFWWGGAFLARTHADSLQNDKMMRHNTRHNSLHRRSQTYT